MAEPSGSEAAQTQSIVNESTPLLSASNEDAISSAPDDHGLETNASGIADHGVHLTRSTKVPMLMSISNAVVVFIMVAVLTVLLSYRPKMFNLPWSFSYAFPWIALPIVLAAISSALNLKFLQASPPGSRVTPGIVTVILDGILVYWLGYTATQNIESLSYWHASDRCYDYYKPGPSPARDECERFAERIKTVLWVYVGLLLLLTITHLVLLVLRIVSVYRFRSERGRHISRWRVPSWNFSVEFTLKYRNLREEQPTTGDQV